MVEAAQTAIAFVEGRGRSDLDQDRMLLFALVRAIEIIGEAATRISPETRAEAAEIPWRLIVAMRNRLTNAYFDVDRDILWNTATSELPDLLAKLRRLTEIE
jgi:uncharacterized protein with HEPN domain